MHNLSQMQLLSIWSHLEDARIGKHGYGGNVAEIYLYEAMPYSPLVDRFKGNSVFDADTASVYRAARESLLHVFESFEVMRSARVRAEGPLAREFAPLGPWFVERDERHRVHVEVMKRKEPSP